MKTYRKILYTALLALIILVVACSDDDNNGGAPTGNIENLTASNSYGEVILKWKNPDNSNLYYVDISFTDSKGKERSKKVTKFNMDSITGYITDTIIGFTDTEEYEFTLTPCSRGGAKGASVQIKHRPGISALNIVLDAIEFDSDFGGAKIIWQNITKRKVTINVTYRDSESNRPVTASFNASTDGYGFVSGLKDTETSFSVTTVDEELNESEPKTVVLTPLAESKIPKENWSVPGYDPNSNDPQIGYSSQATEEGGAPNGRALAIFDDNKSTFWHASYSSPSSKYPHYLIIDLGKEITISRVEVFRRQGDGRGQTSHQFLTCRDGSLADPQNQTTWGWVDQGKFVFDPKDDEGQSSRLESNPVGRYLKVLMPDKGENDYAMISEINIYGQE